MSCILGLPGWWFIGLDTEESWTYSGANSWQNQWRCKCVLVEYVSLLIYNYHVSSRVAMMLEAWCHFGFY